MTDKSPTVKVQAPAEAPSQAVKKAKKKGAHRRVAEALVHIQSTYNNTLVTVADPSGNVIAWSSAGRIGYGGAKKATPYAAQEVVRDLVKRLEPFQVKEVRVEVTGIGNARESAIRALASLGGFVVTSIRDVTPVPHNGCRPRKPRRV